MHNSFQIGSRLGRFKLEVPDWTGCSQASRTVHHEVQNRIALGDGGLVDSNFLEIGEAKDAYKSLADLGILRFRCAKVASLRHSVIA